MNNEKTVCVLGLGYVGLPTASLFATHGYRVVGVDKNASVVQVLSQGNIHIKEPGLATVVKAAIHSGNMTVKTIPDKADVFIITVPTPFEEKNNVKTADLSYVMNATESIVQFVSPGCMVILESTSPPTTTTKILVPILEKSGLKASSDFFVAYCPERVLPGNALAELINNDRVIGGICQKSADEAEQLYKSFVSGKIYKTDATTAEFVKLLENTYRDVNIALANESAIICEKLGINVWEVIRLANHHPRVALHKPGPGVGGHCIGVDPWFLVDMFHREAKLISKAREINDGMPEHVAKKILHLVSGIDKAKIAVLGISYKGNSDDIRESPGIKVVDYLLNSGKVSVQVYDPYARNSNYETSSLDKVLLGSSLAVILAPHNEFNLLDPVEMGKMMNKKIIFDTHNCLNISKWKEAGFSYHLLGS